MTDDEGKVKKGRDPIFMTCLVVFLLASCAIIGASVYDDNIKADDTLAHTGSNVSVNYVGSFYGYEGSEYALVFDTSHWSIANNKDIPKSGDFVLGSESKYKPLNFVIGSGTVIPGFGNSVVGHKVGDKISVEIPVGEGYNAPDTLTTVNVSEIITMPSSETMTLEQFQKYYKINLDGTTFIEKSAYGWPAYASYNSSDGSVTVSYQPEVGKAYVVVKTAEDKPQVTLTVTSASGTGISYTYKVSNYVSTGVTTATGEAEIQMIKVDFGSSSFYITSVTDKYNDGEADTFTYKTAGEKYNQILYFTIEVVAIK